jgi:hypothetical protein
VSAGRGRTGLTLRDKLRSAFFRLLRHIANIEDTRQILGERLAEVNLPPPPPELLALPSAVPPYAELARSDEVSRDTDRSDVIFITGRFRSGSTLLWNLFRSLPGMTAYYEPFNERRWFDPTVRGSHVDPTHLNVDDYWSEYDGLEILGRYFSGDWKFRHLYMPAHAWNPAMQRYIETLIARARGRPVLQFNEVDMRLPWLRARFPGAKILHVFRHPRDQWCSTLPGVALQSRNSTLREFASVDGFYLLSWGRDLRHYFPFLNLDEDAHPYELFYQIWKISYLFGRVHADLSIAYEDIVREPAAGIRRTFAALAVAEQDIERLASLVSSVPLGKWRQYADDAWFTAIEKRVDAVLESYAAGLVSCGAGAVATISPTTRRG